MATQASITANVEDGKTISSRVEQGTTISAGISPGGAGPGVPTGGSTGQVLRKASSSDNDTEWHTLGSFAEISSLAHSALTGLTSGDDHTQYALLAGRSGGQIFIGDTSSGGNLTLQSTAHATRGKVLIGTLASFDEVAGGLKIGGTGAPAQALDVTGSVFSSAFFRTNSGIVNNSSAVNSSVLTAATGTSITRNVADSNPVLKLTNQNASSTGDILRTINTASATVFTVDKDGSVLRLRDKGGQVYNVKAYGAVGDGVTDDTAAIQAAINATNGHLVYFPLGNYLVTSSITITKNVTLQGGGVGSKITADGATVSPFLKMGDTTRRTNINFNNLQFVSSTAGSGLGIDANYFTISKFKDLAFTGFNRGILFDDGGGAGIPTYNLVEDCQITISGSGSYGVKFSGNANENTLLRLRIATDSNSTGVIVNAHSNSLYDVDVETGALYGVDVQASGHGTLISGLYAEGNATGFHKASGALGVSLIGSDIHDSTTANITDDDAGTASAATYIGNWIQYLAQTPNLPSLSIASLGGVLKASSGVVAGSATLTDIGTPTANFSMGSHKITSVTDPTSAQDAATKMYVDTAVSGQNYKEAAKYATTAALPTVVYSNGSSGVGATLTGAVVGAISIDSASPTVGQRILVKDQVDQTQNGIYTITATGSGIAVFVMTRTTDFDAGSKISDGDAVYVLSGTVNSGTTWVQTTVAPITTGTSNLVFAQVAGPGSLIAGSGISVSGLTISVAAGGVTNSMLAGSIAASKLVGTDIATVGTITAGVWTGTTIAIAKGGTGATTAASALAALSGAATASFSMNGQKITSLTDGAAASDAAAFGQIPTAYGSVPAVASGTAPTAGSSANWAKGDHAHPTYGFQPGDQSLLAWAYDPVAGANSTALATAGTVYVIKIHCPVAISVTNIIMQIVTQGSSLTTGQCFAALYQSGTLLGTTADQATAWGTTGTKTMAISGGAVNVAAGDVYVAAFFNGSTGPAFTRGLAANSINTGLSGTVARFGTADTGRTTTMPSPLGTITGLAISYWAALS